MQPLEGIRVLELTTFLNGPYTGRLLAELGAEVIKIEPPWGDPYRAVSPLVGESSLHFIFTNANKKFITLNLKSEKGRALFLRLAEHSDVIIENFRPGTLEKIGLGYSDVAKVNPRIIYASCSGYGHEGPYREYPGFDPCVQAVSGLMDTNGFPGMPTRLGMGILDLATPAFTTTAILAALRYRDMTGRGQRIDMSLFDVAVILSQQSMVYHMAGQPVRIGPSSNIFAPEYLFKTSDGYVYVVVHTEEAWRKLAAAFGHPELGEDPRFRTNNDRMRNREELLKIVSEWFAGIKSDEAMEIVNRSGGVAGKFKELGEQLYDPHVVARGLYVDMELSMEGGRRVRIPGSVFKLSETPGAVKKASSPIGSDNAAVYGEILGLDDAALKELRAEGVI